jgi:biotin carboxylase
MDSVKKIMIIGAGILQLPAIKMANEMGLYVIAVDIDPNAPGFKFADNCIQISTIDIDKVVEEAICLDVDAVMTLASDLPIRTVAAIGERLGLTTISEDTAIKATDKGKMRKQLKEHNVPIPNFYITKNYEDFQKATLNFNMPFIVKPSDNSGSRGVILVEEASDLLKVYEYTKQYSRSGEVLIEEYMAGPEVSVETLTVNGVTNVISITDKLTTGAPNFIEMGHSIPSQLSQDIQNEIIKITKSAIKAIGIDVGPSHTELIVTDEGPKIVELGARLGGDNITSHLVPLATGINMVECTILLSLGEKPILLPKYKKGASIRYIKAPEGIIHSVDYLQKANEIHGINEIILLKNIGERINKIKNSNDRIGYVIAQADSPAESTRICEEAINTMKINVAD